MERVAWNLIRTVLWILLYVIRNTHHASRLLLDEAPKMLSEIYGWFIEGVDTQDVQESQVLLGGL